MQPCHVTEAEAGSGCAGEGEGHGGGCSWPPRMSRAAYLRRGSAGQPGGGFIERCVHCAHVLEATSVQHSAGSGGTITTAGTRIRCARIFWSGCEPCIRRLKRGEKSAWKCPLCAFGVPQGGLDGCSKMQFRRARDRHRYEHHPAVSRGEYVKQSRTIATRRPDTCMLQRARCLNVHQAARWSAGTVANCVAFTWPRVKMRRQHQRLNLGAAWLFDLLRLARKHRCRPLPQCVVKQRIKTLKKTRREARGLNHGVGQELLKTIFERAFCMVGGDPVQP